MKKVLLATVLVFFAFLQITLAQVNAYTFTTATGTYTEITGGTLVGNESSDDQRFVDPATPLGGTTLTGVGLPIGFTFTFDNEDFDVFAINANGWISLGNSSLTPAVNIASSSSYIPLGSTSAITPDKLASRIALFSRDLNAQTGAELRYETIGTAPNRVLVVQWKNFRKYGVTGDSYNGQIRLYETTNVIEVVYGTMTNNTTSTTVQVGLRGAPATTASNYANRTTTTDWAASTAGSAATATMTLTDAIYPASGLTYTWTPASCYTPTALTASNITNSSADISWTAPTIGTPDSYEWKIVLSGAGSGGTAVASGTLTHPTVNAQATGLNSATNYHLYVRTFCGGTDYSNWAGPITITTLCDIVTAFYENFDGVTASALPACWVKVGTTGTVQTQTSNNFSAPNCLYVYTSSTTSPVVAAMPAVSNAGANTHRLVFQARSNFSATTTLEVGYLTDISDPASFVLLESKALTTTYQAFEVIPGTAPGSNQYFAFRSTLTNSLLIDDVKWEAIPTCLGVNQLGVQNLLANSVDLTWTEVGTATTWNIEWGLEGFTQGSGTIVSTTTNPHSLTQLTPSTAYSFYVQSDCGGGDLSAWAGPFTFTTPCLPLSIPYFEGFEGITANDELPACMAATSLGTKNRTYIASDTYNRMPKSGDKFASFAWAPAGNWFFFAPVELTGGVAYDASVWYITDGATGFTALNMAYGTAQEGTSMTQIASVADPNNTTYMKLESTFIPPATGVYYLGIQAEGTSTSPWYLTIDDIGITVAPTCPGISVTSFASSNITSNSADLSWTELGSATEWQIEYGVTGFTLGTGTSAIVTTNSHTLQGLNSVTTYQVYIRSICTPGDTSTWKGPISFTTECGIYAAPIVQNFDAVATPNLPVCWSKIVVASNTFARVQTITTSSPESTPNHVEMYNSATAGATTYLMLVSPELSDLSAGTNWLKFKAKRGTNAEDLVVGTITDPTDGATFTSLITISDLTNSYKEYIIPFTSYTGTDTYIAFKHANTASTRYVYLDDIAWEVMPSCPGLIPGSIVSSNPTLTSVDLAWTEFTTSTEWQIEYGVTGFAQGTGTFVTANTNPYTLGGLTESTTYQAYVRSICAVGDTSVWVGPFTFSTSCGTFSAPMAQNFDGISIPELPLCWSKIVVATNTIARVRTITTTTPFSTPNHVEMFNSTSTLATTNLLLVSPQMTDLGTGNNRLRFMAKRGSTAQDVIVGTITDPTDPATFTPLQTITPTNTYTEYIVNFDTYSGSDEYFAFKHASTTASTYIYLDNINWEPIPTCLEPVYNSLAAANPTTNSIDLSWVDNGSPTAWEIEYGMTGFTQGTGTIVQVNSNPYTLTGLQHSSTYEAYVRVDCGSGDYSMWRGPVTFSTECGVWSIPFAQDFTGVTAATIPLCWDRTHTNWAVVASSDAGGTSPEVRFNWSPTSVDVFKLYTPELDVTLLGSLYIKFKQSTNHFTSASDDYTLALLITTNGTDWDTIWQVIPNASIAPEELYFDLTAYVGNTIQLAWMFDGNSNDINQWYIDDIYVGEIPACDLPTSLDAINITATSAELTWVGETYNGWEIEWDTTGFAQGTGTTAYTTAFPHALAGLDVFTSYDFYVRAYCMFDTTAWAGPYTFTTLDSCYAPDSVDVIDVSLNFVELAWYSTGSIWEIEWDMAGFTQGSGSTVITDDNPYILSGLVSGAVYEFYIRTVCDSVLGVYSDWAGPYSFVTLCNVVDAFPWNDQFDNAVAPDFFPCWNKIWSSGGETWYVEDFQAQFGTQYVGIDYDDMTVQNELIATPIFDFSYLAHPYISFWWNMSYYWAVDPMDNYDVYLLVTTDNGNTIDTLWSETDEGTFTSWTWYETMIDLTAYAGESNVMLGFNYAGFDGAAFYFDNVTVHDTTTVGVVKPIVTDLNVNIYPNPSNGLFNMYMLSDTETLTVTVLNIQGKVVYEEQLSGMAYGVNAELNLRNLASGMYHLRLSDGKSTLNKKLIIN